MKKRDSISILFVLGMILPAMTVEATTYTFTGFTDNTWGDADNWSPPGGPPGSADTAIIPYNKTVTTNGADEACKVLEIQNNGNPRGLLTITQGSTFSLHGTALTPSTLNGRIFFGTKAGESDAPVLEIVNSMTIEGDNFGVIVGKTSGGTKGIIRGESSSDVLTFAIASNVGPIMAGEIDIEVEFVNNTRVIAGGGGTTMTLKTNPKSGTGLWSVDGGVLLVDIEVTGTGEWLMDPHISGTIRFTANCENLEGDFNVKAGGTLDIQSNLCTTGDIEWIGGSILVDNASSDNAAVFGAWGCSTP